jgi:hypothetical protein
MEYTNSHIKALIMEHLHSSRDRAILYDRLVNGLTFDALSAKFQLSDRQIKTIVYKAEAILFKHLPP